MSGQPGGDNRGTSEVEVSLRAGSVIAIELIEVDSLSPIPKEDTWPLWSIITLPASLSVTASIAGVEGVIELGFKLLPRDLVIEGLYIHVSLVISSSIMSCCIFCVFTFCV